MAKSKMRLRFPNIILLLCGLILLIFLFDFLWRNVLSPTVPGDTEGIITADGTFATDENVPATDAEETTEESTDEEQTTTEATTEKPTEDPNIQMVTLTQSQIHNGPLILVSGTCPFIGDTDFIDFTSCDNIQPSLVQHIKSRYETYCYWPI